MEAKGKIWKREGLDEQWERTRERGNKCIENEKEERNRMQNAKTCQFVGPQLSHVTIARAWRNIEKSSQDIYIIQIKQQQKGR